MNRSPDLFGRQLEWTRTPTPRGACLLRGARRRCEGCLWVPRAREHPGPPSPNYKPPSSGSCMRPPGAATAEGAGGQRLHLPECPGGCAQGVAPGLRGEPAAAGAAGDRPGPGSAGTALWDQLLRSASTMFMHLDTRVHTHTHTRARWAPSARAAGEAPPPGAWFRLL